MENLLCKEVYELAVLTTARQRTYRILPIVAVPAVVLFGTTTDGGWLAALIFVGVMTAFCAFVFPRVQLVRFRTLWGAWVAAKGNTGGALVGGAFPFVLVCGQKRGALPGWPGGAIYFGPSRLVFIPFKANAFKVQPPIEMGRPEDLEVDITPAWRWAIQRFFLGAESALTFRGPKVELRLNVPDPRMTVEAVEMALKLLRSEMGLENA